MLRDLGAAAEHPGAGRGAPELGVGLGDRVLGGLELPASAGLRREQILLPLELAAGGHQIRARLPRVGERAAHLGRVHHRERRAPLDSLSELDEDLPDAAADGREDMGDALLVEGDAAARHQLGGQVALLGGDGRDLGRVLLLRRDPHLAGGRVEGGGLGGLVAARRGQTGAETGAAEGERNRADVLHGASSLPVAARSA